MSLFSRKTASGQKLWVRIVALALAALMLIGSLYIALSLIISSAAAEGTLESYAFSTSIKNNEFYVAVGIRYGSSVTVSHTFTAPYGFVAGEAYIESGSKRSFTPLFFIDAASVVVACDANLSVLAGKCSLASSAAKTDIGAYHIELTLNDGNVWDKLDELNAEFAFDYEHVFPSYNNGVKSVRIGAYPDYSSAGDAAAVIGETLEGYNISVASPSSSGICVLNVDCDTILFEHAGDGDYIGAIAPQQMKDAEKAYTFYKTTGYMYPGAFCFRRYINNSHKGLTLINLTDLQSYVEGVLPNEIVTSWPLETQKAFAIIVRSYTAGCIGQKYSSYGFDLVNTAASQVYRGRHQITDKVIQAVAETKDTILVCDGKMITSYYSSSQGGWTVDSKYVWGSSIGPYIINQPTPWEQYSVTSRAFWNFEMTQKELLSGFGIYNSGDTVANVSLEFAGESPYVYKMSVKDSKGNVATKTRCSKVVGVMDNYGANSANFLIGKGSLDYTYENVISTKIISLDASYAENMNVYTANGIAVESAGKFNFFTKLGQAFSNLSSSLYVHTGKGTAILTQNIEIPTTSKPDKDGYYTHVCDYGNFLIVTELQQVTKTYKASSSSNYVVVGRGWGHGVGVSQYGTAHLGQAGAKYNHILAAYYPNTQLANFYDYLK